MPRPRGRKLSAHTALIAQLLTQAIYREVVKTVAAGANPMALVEAGPEAGINLHSHLKIGCSGRTADRSTALLRSSGRDDKGRVVAYLGSCDWDVWTSSK
jgi:hypothetical protein